MKVVTITGRTGMSKSRVMDKDYEKKWYVCRQCGTALKEGRCPVCKTVKRKRNIFVYPKGRVKK